MDLPLCHEWPTTTEAAISLQQSLRHQVVTTDQLGPVRYVAGVDVGFEQDGAVTRAAVAVLKLEDLSLCDRAIARRPTTFPYIPGLLSFREIPAVLDALARIQIEPDVLLCDGQGIAHPRRLGIASHLGVVIDRPTIGVAKSLLVGHHAELGLEKGSCQPLLHKGEQIGMALRSRTGTKPIYISPGHRISLDTAMEYVRRCLTKYRLPETTRQAHRLASGPAIDQPPLEQRPNLPPQATEQMTLDL